VRYRRMPHRNYLRCCGFSADRFSVLPCLTVEKGRTFHAPVVLLVSGEARDIAKLFLVVHLLFTSAFVAPARGRNF
jgi:hypothetical protein